MSSLDAVTATWDAARVALVAVLPPQAIGRRVTLMTITGPARSTLEIFRGYVPELPGRITSVSPAASRTWDASGSSPIDIRPGEAACLIWSGGATNSASAATATIISEVY